MRNLPTASDLGADPEPYGVRFEALLGPMGRAPKAPTPLGTSARELDLRLVFHAGRRGVVRSPLRTHDQQPSRRRATAIVPASSVEQRIG
jgi:hypothetical protein